jgi:uncharacterized Zn finger protein
MGWGNYGGFAPYVSKAEKMRKAEKALAALKKKKGAVIEPVILAGREIARTWWGKAWMQNLERYADFENRLPRGRTYVRSGSVLDLKISANTITALVAGSRSQPYKIAITIKPLEKKAEKSLMAKSRASLDSLQSLLSGEFPTDLKEEFFKQGSGLFPSPKEIALDCSCPDWADMCKHVAAALYGAAARLDEKPELFFVLRGIKIDDFVGTMVKAESRKMLKKAATKSSRTIIAKDNELADLFGIELGSAEIVDKKLPVKKPARKATESVKSKKAAPVGKIAKVKPAKKSVVKMKRGVRSGKREEGRSKM